MKKHFPLLTSNDQLIYLDSAATSHKPQAVIDAVTRFYSSNNATVHRALYPTGEAATESYELAREKVAEFINAGSAAEVIFTKGTTEGINFVATSWGLANLGPGDEIVLTEAEHHANLLPWQRVAQHTGAKLIFIPINKTTYTLNNPQTYLSNRTRLVALTIDSNVLGPIWGEASALMSFLHEAKALGARILIDAAQIVAHKKLDVRTLKADFVVFSVHKMFGPTGIGVLYIARELHNTLEPYHVGGSMVHAVTFQHAQWAQSPHKFEAGTPPIAQAIGLGAAVDFITTNIDFTHLEKHEAQLCTALIEGLRNNDEVIIAGNQDLLSQSGHVVSIAFRTLHPHDVAAYLGSHNIAVRAGHFCAQPLVSELGYKSLLRISFAVYNDQHDINAFLQALNACITLFKKNLSS